MKNQLISLPRFGKQVLVLLVDAFSIALAVWLAYSIRLDRLHFPVGVEFLVYVVSLVVALPIFVRMGLYRAVFR